MLGGVGWMDLHAPWCRPRAPAHIPYRCHKVESSAWPGLLSPKLVRGWFIHPLTRCNAFALAIAQYRCGTHTSVSRSVTLRLAFCLIQTLSTCKLGFVFTTRADRERTEEDGWLCDCRLSWRVASASLALASQATGAPLQRLDRQSYRLLRRVTTQYQVEKSRQIRLQTEAGEVLRN